MKLQTQFTVPKKDLNDVDYIRKMETLEKTLKKRFTSLSPPRKVLLVFYIEF